MAQLPKDILLTSAAEMMGGEVRDMSLDRLVHLITVSQYITDVLLNEIERRDELTFSQLDGAPIIPYHSDYMVETILTRQ